MRKMSSSFIGLATALALTVAACGDDPTGVNSGDELSSVEVAAVIAAFGSAFDSVGAAAQQASGAAAAPAAVSFNESFDLSFPCESGDIEVSGSTSGNVDEETFDYDFTVDVSWDPNGCVVSDDINTFTVDGAPSIVVALEMSSTQDVLTISGTETGGFSYTSSDGRFGSCAFDVTFSVVTGQTGIDSTVTGTICGLDAATFETLGT